MLLLSRFLCRLPTCKQHATEPLSLVCIDCNYTAICKECVSSSAHAGHRVVSTREALSTVRSTLADHYFALTRQLFELNNIDLALKNSKTQAKTLLGANSQKIRTAFRSAQNVLKNITVEAEQKIAHLQQRGAQKLKTLNDECVVFEEYLKAKQRQLLLLMKLGYFSPAAALNAFVDIKPTIEALESDTDYLPDMRKHMTIPFWRLKTAHSDNLLEKTETEIIKASEQLTDDLQHLTEIVDEFCEKDVPLQGWPSDYIATEAEEQALRQRIQRESLYAPVIYKHGRVPYRSNFLQKEPTEYQAFVRKDPFHPSWAIRMVSLRGQYICIHKEAKSPFSALESLFLLSDYTVCRSFSDPGVTALAAAALSDYPFGIEIIQLNSAMLPAPDRRKTAARRRRSEESAAEIPTESAATAAAQAANEDAEAAASSVDVAAATTPSAVVAAAIDVEGRGGSTRVREARAVSASAAATAVEEDAFSSVDASTEGVSLISSYILLAAESAELVDEWLTLLQPLCKPYKLKKHEQAAGLLAAQETQPNLPAVPPDEPLALLAPAAAVAGLPFAVYHRLMAAGLPVRAATGADQQQSEISSSSSSFYSGKESSDRRRSSSSWTSRRSLSEERSSLTNSSSQLYSLSSSSSSWVSTEKVSNSSPASSSVDNNSDTLSSQKSSLLSWQKQQRRSQSKRKTHRKAVALASHHLRDNFKSNNTSGASSSSSISSSKKSNKSNRREQHQCMPTTTTTTRRTVRRRKNRSVTDRQTKEQLKNIRRNSCSLLSRKQQQLQKKTGKLNMSRSSRLQQVTAAGEGGRRSRSSSSSSKRQRHSKFRLKEVNDGDSSSRNNSSSSCVEDTLLKLRRLVADRRAHVQENVAAEAAPSAVRRILHRNREFSRLDDAVEKKKIDGGSILRSSRKTHKRQTQAAAAAAAGSRRMKGHKHFLLENGPALEGRISRKDSESADTGLKPSEVKLKGDWRLRNQQQEPLFCTGGGGGSSGVTQQKSFQALQKKQGKRGERQAEQQQSQQQQQHQQTATFSQAPQHLRSAQPTHREADTSCMQSTAVTLAAEGAFVSTKSAKTYAETAEEPKEAKAATTPVRAVARVAAAQTEKLAPKIATAKLESATEEPVELAIGESTEKGSVAAREGGRFIATGVQERFAVASDLQQQHQQHASHRGANAQDNSSESEMVAGAQQPSAVFAAPKQCAPAAVAEKSIYTAEKSAARREEHTDGDSGANEMKLGKECAHALQETLLSKQPEHQYTAVTKAIFSEAGHLLFSQNALFASPQAPLPQRPQKCMQQEALEENFWFSKQQLLDRELAAPRRRERMEILWNGQTQHFSSPSGTRQSSLDRSSLRAAAVSKSGFDSTNRKATAAAAPAARKRPAIEAGKKKAAAAAAPFRGTPLQPRQHQNAEKEFGKDDSTPSAHHSFASAAAPDQDVAAASTRTDVVAMSRDTQIEAAHLGGQRAIALTGREITLENDAWSIWEDSTGNAVSSAVQYDTSCSRSYLESSSWATDTNWRTVHTAATTTALSHFNTTPTGRARPSQTSSVPLIGEAAAAAAPSLAAAAQKSSGFLPSSSSTGKQQFYHIHGAVAASVPTPVLRRTKMKNKQGLFSVDPSLRINFPPASRIPTFVSTTAEGNISAGEETPKNTGALQAPENIPKLLEFQSDMVGLESESLSCENTNSSSTQMVLQRRHRPALRRKKPTLPTPWTSRHSKNRQTAVDASVEETMQQQHQQGVKDGSSAAGSDAPVTINLSVSDAAATALSEAEPETTKADPVASSQTVETRGPRIERHNRSTELVTNEFTATAAATDAAANETVDVSPQTIVRMLTQIGSQRIG